MADIAFHHGTRVFESDETLVLIRTAQSAIIAILGTAPDADASVFPLNDPVLIKGASELSKAKKLGEDGTLKAAVDAVFDQIATFVYVIRVAEGANAAETLSNLVGDVTALTGVHALKKIEGKYGRKFKARLICAPGFTAALATDGISGITITVPGTGYSAAPVVEIDGDGQGAEAQAVVTNGTITSIIVTKPGFGYTEATVTITDGTGSNATATATIGTVANPVAAELQGILEALRAVAFVDGPDSTDQAAVAYRQTINSARIYICDPKVKVWDTELDAYVPQPSSARFAGVQARTDREKGFWHSLSNKAINGIGGTTRPVSYGDHANYLNENHINSIINLGEGFITWGNRSATGLDLWKFLAVRRTADFINEAIEEAYLEFVDKPFSEANLKLMIESGKAFMRTLRAEGAILGGSVWLDSERNSPTEMAQGRVTMGVEFEPVAPMEDIRFIAHRNPARYQILLDRVLSEQNDALFAEGGIST